MTSCFQFFFVNFDNAVVNLVQSITIKGMAIALCRHCFPVERERSFNCRLVFLHCLFEAQSLSRYKTKRSATPSFRRVTWLCYGLQLQPTVGRPCHRYSYAFISMTGRNRATRAQPERSCVPFISPPCSNPLRTETAALVTW